MRPAADRVVAARVAAWLAVGGSWAAIATAHHERDVAAFEACIRPLITGPDGGLLAADAVVPVQLALFDTAA